MHPMAPHMSQPPAAISPGNRFQSLGFPTSQTLANSTSQTSQTRANPSSQRAQTMVNTSAARNTRSMRVEDHTSLSQAANHPSTQQRLQSELMTNQNYERSQHRANPGAQRYQPSVTSTNQRSSPYQHMGQRSLPVANPTNQRSQPMAYSSPQTMARFPHQRSLPEAYPSAQQAPSPRPQAALLAIQPTLFSQQGLAPGEARPSPRSLGEAKGGLRVLTGRVGRVREWLGLGIPGPVIYRVHGSLGQVDTLPSSRGRSKTHVFSVCGEDGQSLPCTYQEVDRDLGSARQGERVVVVARGQADGTLQVISVEAGARQEADHCLSRMENFAVRGIRLAFQQRDGLV